MVTSTSPIGAPAPDPGVKPRSPAPGGGGQRDTQPGETLNMWAPGSI